MNKEDILRAARGSILRQCYKYVVEVCDGRFTLVEKCAINSSDDMVISVVYTKEDVSLSKSEQFDRFVHSCQSQPCTNLAKRFAIDIINSNHEFRFCEAVARSPDGRKEKQCCKIEN